MKVSIDKKIKDLRKIMNEDLIIVISVEKNKIEIKSIQPKQIELEDDENENPSLFNNKRTTPLINSTEDYIG